MYANPTPRPLDSAVAPRRSTPLARFAVHLIAAVAFLTLHGCGSGGTSHGPGPDSSAAIVDAALKNSGTPGIVAVVVKTEQSESVARGLRCLGQPALLQRGDPVHIGSLAKAILATTAAIAVERGEIRWDSTIGEVLPDLAAAGEPAFRDVTLAELFRHRGGFAALDSAVDLAAVPAFSGTPRVQRAAFVAWLLSQAPAVAPHSAALYSNAGVIVAAAMLERVTGTDAETLEQDRLFRPLGIAAAFAYPAQMDRAAPCGHELEGTQLTALDLRSPAYAVPAWLGPVGHLSMSIDDYARFLRFALDAAQGRSTLLSAPAFDELLRPVDGYAAGWALLEGADGTLYWHAGGLVGFYAIVVFDPAHDLAVAAIANADPSVSEQAAVDVVNRLYLTARGRS